MKTIIYDVETRTLDPFDPDAGIVLAGALDVETRKVDTGEPSSVLSLKDTGMLVGHNIRFDLLQTWAHCWRSIGSDLYAWIHKHVLWDTMIAQYLLHGAQMCSLEDACKHYDIPFEKDAAVLEAFQKPGGAANVPEAALNIYLVKDLRATEKLFACQVAEAEERGMLRLLQAHMEVENMLAHGEMNGVPINVAAAEAAAQEALAASGQHLLKMEQAMARYAEALECDEDETAAMIAFNPASHQQLTALIDGGELPYVAHEVIGIYKTGKRAGEEKTRRVKKTLRLPPSGSRPLTRGSVTADVVEKLVERESCNPHVHAVLGEVVKFRKAQKVAQTYYVPFAKLAGYRNGAVTPRMLTCNTPTGRFTSSKPNLQNLPDGKVAPVRAVIEARPGYYIMAADWAQLELVALGELCAVNGVAGAGKLRWALLAGHDIHAEIGQRAQVDRKVAKRIVFGTIYGGSAAGLAEKMGLDRRVVRAVQDSMNSLYPEIRAFGELQWANWGVSRKQVSHSGTLRWEQKCPITGRVYRYEAPIHDEKSVMTKLRNYPVQGLATGDIAPLMAAWQWRRVDPEMAKFVMMVHDEVVYEVKQEYCKTMHMSMRTHLQAFDGMLSHWFGSEWKGLCQVECTVGPNYLDQEVIT